MEGPLSHIDPEGVTEQIRKEGGDDQEQQPEASFEPEIFQEKPAEKDDEDEVKDQTQ